MEPKNREQRRREKYGKPGGATKSVWPASEVNPVLKRSADDQARRALNPRRMSTRRRLPALRPMAIRPPMKAPIRTTARRADRAISQPDSLAMLRR